MQILTERSLSVEKAPTIGEPILCQALGSSADHAPIPQTGFLSHAPGSAGAPTQQIEMSDAEG
jgi:hypothetical protein